MPELELPKWVINDFQDIFLDAFDALAAYLRQNVRPGEWNPLIESYALTLREELEERAREKYRSVIEKANDDISEILVSVIGVGVIFDVSLADRLYNGFAAEIELLFSRLVGEVKREAITSSTKTELKSKLRSILRKHRNWFISASWMEPLKAYFGYIYEKLRELRAMGYKVYWEWYTVRDDKVCPICRGLDGRRVPVGKPFGYVNGRPIYSPPAHVNCRCGIRRVEVVTR